MAGGRVRLWAPALAVLAALAGPAGGDGAAEAHAGGAFTLWFGGLNAGTLEVALDTGPEGYAARAEGRPAGWLSALFSAALSAEGEGAAAPARFAARVAFGDDRQRVEVVRGPDGAPRVTADPPFRPRPWQIDPAAQGDAVDPMWLPAALLAPTPPEALCALEADVFDGRRRSRLALGSAVQGADGLWRCDGSWTRVAGFRDRDLARPPLPVGLAFAEGGDGLARLVRAEVSTRWGTGVALR